MFVLGEIAEILDIKQRDLYNWVQRGFVVPFESKNGRYFYSQGNLNQFQVLKELSHLGLKQTVTTLILPKLVKLHVNPQVRSIYMVFNADGVKIVTTKQELYRSILLKHTHWHLKRDNSYPVVVVLDYSYIITKVKRALIEYKKKIYAASNPPQPSKVALKKKRHAKIG